MPSRRTVCRAVGAVGCASLAGCLAADQSFDALETDPDTWRLSGYDTRNSGHNVEATVPDEPTERWQWDGDASIGDDVVALVVDDELVIAALEDSASQVLVALERDGGELRWEHGAGVSVAGLALGTDTAYATNERELVAYDLEDGEERWSVDVSGGATSAILFDGETVYRSAYQGITAYDGDDGAELWTASVGGSGPNESVIADGRLFLNGPGAAAAFDPQESGVRFWEDERPEQRWTASLPSFGTELLVWDDLVVAGVEPVRGSASEAKDEVEALLAFDREDGEPRWEVEFSDSSVRPAVAVDDRVLVHADDLAAVDAGGEIDWQRDGTGPTIAAGGTVFAGGTSEDPGVTALDPADGEPRWDLEFDVGQPGTNSAGVTALAAVDGLLVVGVEGGHVVALGE